MNQPYKAYSKANYTVSKTRQVVMLYDGAIRFMQQGVEAIEKKDFEARYNKFTRVSEILMGLQSCLDFEAGGQSAKILYDFYSSLDLRIFTLQRTNDLEECNAVIAQLKEMRDVWYGIDRGAEMRADEQGEKPTPPDNDPMTVSA